MAKYSTFLYGTGVLYGFSTTVDSISPPEGPSIGGNGFILKGSGFDPRQWDDEFTNIVLDAVKWTDISSGSGAVSTGTFHLQLATGLTVGSVAGIESKALFNDTQGEIKLIINPINVLPLGIVNLLNFELWVDANNYASLSITMDTVADSINISCKVYVGGFISDQNVIIPWTRGTSVIKILRKDSTVYFIANGMVIFKSVRFTNLPAIFRFYSTNNAEPYDVNQLIVEWFYFRPVVSFGDQVVHETIVVSDNRARGVVPPSIDDKQQEAAYAGLVDVSMIGVGTYTLVNAYRYYYLDGLKVINNIQFDTTLAIINDDQVLTPTGYNKGLGEGK